MMEPKFARWLSPGDAAALRFYGYYGLHRESGIMAMEWQRWTRGADESTRGMFADRLALIEDTYISIAKDRSKDDREK